MKVSVRILWLIYLGVLNKAKRFATISIYSFHEHIQKNIGTIIPKKDIAQNPRVLILEAYPTTNIVRHI